MVFSGSGGQGVITASIIVAEAAVVYDELNAVQTQTYGPEARGGATRADVIISQEPIYYPKVINPHILVCLTQKAYDRFSGIIRPGGLLLTDSRFVKTERKVDARQVELEMYDTVIEEIGSPIVFNICMLGALIALSRVVREESVKQVLKARVAPKFVEPNTKALDIGLRLGSGRH